MAPRSLANETPQVHRSEQERHRPALFRWHDIDPHRLRSVLFNVNSLPPLKLGSFHINTLVSVFSWKIYRPGNSGPSFVLSNNSLELLHHFRQAYPLHPTTVLVFSRERHVAPATFRSETQGLATPGPLGHAMDSETNWWHMGVTLDCGRAGEISFCAEGTDSFAPKHTFEQQWLVKWSREVPKGSTKNWDINEDFWRSKTRLGSRGHRHSQLKRTIGNN